MKNKLQSTQATPSHLDLSAVEAELLWLSDSAKEKLLANKIYNALIRLFRLDDNPLSVLFLAVTISALLLLLKAAISTFFYAAPFLFPLGSVLASFLISFSLAAVKILHDVILPPNAKKMLGFIDQAAVQPLRRWFDSFLSYPRQILFSTLIGVLALVTLYYVDRLTTADFDITDYVLGALAIFCVGHGGYCGLAIPTIVKPLCHGEMKLFWLNPAASEPIKIASWGFRLLSMADAVFVALCMTSLYWFKPWESNLVAAISAIWLAVGLLSVSYTFFYPHYYLDQAIERNKKKVIVHGAPRLILKKV
jgi:hypothetical protein